MHTNRLIFDKPGRRRIYGSILETIGNTPLLRIGRLAQDSGCQAEVLAKLEFLDPLASVNGRFALSTIEALEAQAAIGPGGVVVGPISGDAGIGLAFVCAAKGYRCILTMPDCVSIEQRKLMRLLGAELFLTPREKGVGGAVEKAREIAARTERAAMPWRCGSPANPDIHSRATAEEIWVDTNGVVDAVVIGAGGALACVGEALKARNPDLRMIAVEILGADCSPDALDASLTDEALLVSNEEAIETARRAALLEGIAAGVSSGAALAGALRVAARDEMRGRTVVTLLPSCAEQCFSTALFAHLADG